jgi:hypothetical protein
MLSAAALALGSGADDEAVAQGHYIARCYDANGNLKWEDHYDNLVTDSGARDLLDKYLSGSGYTATFYVGLIGAVGYGAGPVAADTSGSHAGWTEAGSANAPTYSQVVRPTASFSAAAARTKALASAATFSITSAGAIKGSFLSNVAAKDAASGVLFSAGLFSGGDKVVASGDTINVSYSLTV